VQAVVVEQEAVEQEVVEQAAVEQEVVELAVDKTIPRATRRV